MSNIIFKIRKYLKKHRNITNIFIFFIVFTIFVGFSMLFIKIDKKPVEAKVEDVKTEEIKIETIEPITYSSLKSNEEIAEEVIKGLWGNGEERIQALTNSGYNATAIQVIVDSKTPKPIVNKTIVNNNVNNSIYDNAYTIWTILRQKGYSKEICAGIIGNIQQECGLNWQSISSSGIGICQWCGTRKNNLISRFGSNPNLEEQVEFLTEELQAYSGIFNCNTVIDATNYFCYKFERPSKPAISNRQKYANNWYNVFSNIG